MSEGRLGDLLEQRRQAFRRWDEAAGDSKQTLAADLTGMLTVLDRLLLVWLDRALRGLGMERGDVPEAEAYGSSAEEREAAERLEQAVEDQDWQTVLEIVPRLRAGQELVRAGLGGRPRPAARPGPPRRSPGMPDLANSWDDSDEPIGKMSMPDPDLEEALPGDPPPPPLPELDATPPSEGGATEAFQRTPHMDVSPDGPAAPETELDITLWADRQAARAGETSEGIVLNAPASVRTFELTVHLLTSAHFVVTRPAAEPLILDRDAEESNRLQLGVRVRSARELADLGDEVADPNRGYLTAVFRFQGRPAGKVTRLLDVQGPQDSESTRGPRLAEAPATPQGAVAAEVVEEPADLTVNIVADPMEPDRRFHCLLETPHLDLSEDESQAHWTLPRSTSEIVTSYMDLFTASGKSDAQRLAALRGAGLKLFDSAPDNFREVYWRLVDEHGPPRTLALVTEEPHYPWELMIPRRRGPDGRLETREPLGVETAIGRFIHGLSLSGPRRVELRNSYAIAPEYQGRRKLPHAQEEARMVVDLFSGETVRPVTFETLDEALSAKAVSLVHFACHGKQTSGVQQSIYLDDDAELSSVEVAGMAGFSRAFEEGRPLVFLNACEVGRAQPALAAVGGFAATFIELGARAVIAPLWSVKDTLAHKVAEEFYRRISEDRDPPPFSEILRELRQRSYEGDEAGEDTYAAYCFYGDPLAVKGA